VFCEPGHGRGDRRPAGRHRRDSSWEAGGTRCRRERSQGRSDGLCDAHPEGVGCAGPAKRPPPADLLLPDPRLRLQASPPGCPRSRAGTERRGRALAVRMRASAPSSPFPLTVRPTIDSLTRASVGGVTLQRHRRRPEARRRLGNDRATPHGPCTSSSSCFSLSRCHVSLPPASHARLFRCRASAWERAGCRQHGELFYASASLHSCRPRIAPCSCSCPPRRPVCPTDTQSSRLGRGAPSTGVSCCARAFCWPIREKRGLLAGQGRRRRRRPARGAPTPTFTPPAQSSPPAGATARTGGGGG